MSILQTERCILTTLRETDFDAMVRLFTEPDVWKYLGGSPDAEKIWVRTSKVLAGDTVKIINETIRNPWFFTVFFGAMVLPVCTLLLWIRSYRTPAFLLFLTGFVLFSIFVFWITTSINLPLNNYLESWDLQAVPDDWMTVRDSWNRANMIRTWGAIGAFLLYLIGATMAAEADGRQAR